MKQRLVGAAVLVIAAVVFIPMLLDRDDGDAARVLPSPRLVRPEPLPEPLPEDADARTTPLAGESATASAPPPAAAPTPSKPAAAQKRPEPVAKATPAPPPQGGYAVQLGSFAQAANARGLRDRLTAKGYAAFVESAGSVTRVYVGPQKSRADAEEMRKQLETEMRMKGIVVSRPG